MVEDVLNFKENKQTTLQHSNTYKDIPLEENRVIVYLEILNFNLISSW